TGGKRELAEEVAGQALRLDERRDPWHDVGRHGARRVERPSRGRTLLEGAGVHQRGTPRGKDSQQRCGDSPADRAHRALLLSTVACSCSVWDAASPPALLTKTARASWNIQRFCSIFLP